MKKQITLLLLFSILNVSFFACKQNKKNVIDKSIENLNNSPKETELTLPTTFRKDGTLKFLDPKNNKIKTSIAIEIAETPVATTQGLMGREKMDTDNGMLFIMEREEPQSFWMKNTHISLDIIYANSANKIVGIHPHTTPFSEKSIPSDEPALYVIEVNAGYAKLYNLKKGDLISFEKNK